jgi:hypothetical protein
MQRMAGLEFLFQFFFLKKNEHGKVYVSFKKQKKKSSILSPPHINNLSTLIGEQGKMGRGNPLVRRVIAINFYYIILFFFFFLSFLKPQGIKKRRRRRVYNKTHFSDSFHN